MSALPFLRGVSWKVGRVRVFKRVATLSFLCVAFAMETGCGPSAGTGALSEEESNHAHDPEKREEMREAPSGVTFVEGRGLRIAPETREILGIVVTNATERNLPRAFRLTVQIFEEKHHHVLNPQDHSGCDVFGSAFLPTNSAAALALGQPVRLRQGTNDTLNGTLLAVHRVLNLGEAEVVIGLSNATSFIQPGEFLQAEITLPREGLVWAVPDAAVLRTSGGAFLYVVHEDFYRRTPVRVGTESDGWTEITEGLTRGDRVVLRPVEILWLTERSAAQGDDEHSH